MSEPIKVGDLVAVVKPSVCCGNTNRVGYVFAVRKIDPAPGWCLYCHSTLPSEYGSDEGWYSGTRLKRIPPLSELEGQPTQEDIKEPA